MIARSAAARATKQMSHAGVGWNGEIFPYCHCRGSDCPYWDIRVRSNSPLDHDSISGMASWSHLFVWAWSLHKRVFAFVARENRARAARHSTDVERGQTSVRPSLSCRGRSCPSGQPWFVNPAVLTRTGSVSNSVVLAPGNETIPRSPRWIAVAGPEAESWTTKATGRIADQSL